MKEARQSGIAYRKLDWGKKGKNAEFRKRLTTLGRTRDRSYAIPRCDISVKSQDCDMIGVFGEYNTLTLTPTKDRKVTAVLMQDIAGDTAVDVTQSIWAEDRRIVIPGQLIHNIGTSAQPNNDTSEPGVAIKLI